MRFHIAPLAFVIFVLGTQNLKAFWKRLCHDHFDATSAFRLPLAAQQLTELLKDRLLEQLVGMCECTWQGAGGLSGEQTSFVTVLKGTSPASGFSLQGGHLAGSILITAVQFIRFLSIQGYKNCPLSFQAIQLCVRPS